MFPFTKSTQENHFTFQFGTALTTKYSTNMAKLHANLSQMLRIHNIIHDEWSFSFILTSVKLF